MKMNSLESSSPFSPIECSSAHMSRLGNPEYETDVEDRKRLEALLEPCRDFIAEQVGRKREEKSADRESETATGVEA